MLLVQFSTGNDNCLNGKILKQPSARGREAHYRYNAIPVFPVPADLF